MKERTFFSGDGDEGGIVGTHRLAGIDTARARQDVRHARDP